MSFDDLMAQKRLEQAIEGLDQWSQCPGHMVSRYEDMILKPSEEIMRISSHLSINCKANIAQEIAEEYSLKKQIERVKTVAMRKSLLGVQGTYWDEHTLLHDNHINSGSMGMWKTELTKEQVTILETKFRDWLISRGYS